EHHVHLAVRIVDDEGILRQHPARAGRGSSDRWREHPHCILANCDPHIASWTCRYYDLLFDPFLGRVHLCEDPTDRFGQVDGSDWTDELRAGVHGTLG